MQCLWRELHGKSCYLLVSGYAALLFSASNIVDGLSIGGENGLEVNGL